MRPASPRPLALAVAFGLSLALAACQARQDGAAPAAQAAPKAQASRTVASQLGPVQVTEIASGLEHPWAVALLPDGGFLVTERPGRLRRIGADGTVSAPLAGVPAVFAEGQGGLLDVVLAPDFTRSRRIYLSYAEPGENGTAGTAVATATLGDNALGDVKVIYRQQPKLEGPNHFGSRIAFDGQGHVFISQGERNDRPTSQKLDMLQGKLVRLNLDGSVPADNPFVGRQDARPEIWSYGHRNSQSLAVDPRTGKLWEAEHGPRGGDEINLPEPGKNYGWPLATHGINYSGLKIPEAVGTRAPGTEPPYHVWEKSPALSGMAFYVNRPNSKWNDSLFLGALSDGSLIRLSLEGDKIVGEERLLKELGARIRDVRVGADGKVYVVTDDSDGKLLRLDPPGGQAPAANASGG
ncbi:PQQ-dependent sugar dehydrogenase [Vulcaniibacterium tengchongense]|uniref:Glucose/arabinose dehydrogenase n=1 Tax=Vulcaniibacterium tengchongense TaxID=1273429 RepID=A0A3N4VGF2_9GAMM|nr:PQQ-dependent sugar dehydrogenase [Vulcaniibacterium tengchongense]RPE81808.1 glucose/arabinose dehydrogenase [Vulcaniibacterium tengchongense]